MGRPQIAPLSSFDIRIINQIERWRGQHPGWGPKTLYHELANDKRFEGLKLPKPSSIAILLQLKGLTRRYDRHSPMPEQKSNPPKSPHELWQLDAQGTLLFDSIGPITMINIKDVYSLAYCMAFPNKKKFLSGHPKRVDYQCALRLAFMEFGLPQAIQTDHESIFYENKGKSPFPTLLHLWLISLGISHVFSRVHQPTDQAHVERMHQTIESQAINGMSYQNWEVFFLNCQQRRRVLNETYPCSSLANKAPFQAFPQAKHSGRHYNIQLEEQMMDLTRVYEFLAKGKWFRRTSKAHNITLGGHNYYVPQAKPRKQIMAIFDPKTLQILFHDDKELLLAEMPIKGISKQILMGDLFWKLSNVQLEFPFSWEVQKLNTTFLNNS